MIVTDNHKHGLLEAHIHLDRLSKNAAIVRGRVPDKVRIMGVVKCDAYGHGAVRISRTLIEAGVNELVVSDIAEGLVLREAGISCPILVLSDPLYPCLQDVLNNDLIITVADIELAARLLNFPVFAGETFHVHIKIDTGLARFGLTPDQTLEVIVKLSGSAHIQVDGIYSHLSCTFQHDSKSNSITRRQIAVFNSLLSRLENMDLLPLAVHLGSSTGLLSFPKELCSGYFNALRIGTLFYGFTERKNDWHEDLLPIAEIVTHILQVRDLPPGSCAGYHSTDKMICPGRIGVICGGFNHGLHGSSSFLVNGSMAPMIGKPALAQSLIDISKISEAKQGSEVILAGQKLNMRAMAQGLGRGTWEMLLPLLKNSRKIYHQA